MNDYVIHTIDTAPESARPSLAGLHTAFGLIPNVAGVMAGSPTLLNSFFAAFGQVRGAGTFTPGERQVLLLSNAVANDCAWAVAFHSFEAVEDGVAPAEVDAIRRRQLPADPRFAALSALTRTLIDKRGHLDDADLRSFAAAGFGDAQVLEVVTCLAISTMSNHAANVARPPLEEAFRSQAWTAGD
ncbi:carboxymuconolactone decarboxylase family protein [Streptomyces sp. V4-01]|uniref:Carboxymuconolactone decarboxylase family protein n=1 Tax=Actinacidiphila polyblastidii TaxID=3110430 RepID=A0ABU7P9J8_9ACTN|nr:carboxymuconolactone decarboxylase family protein [Streptomyces sp. V4-01]